MKRFFSNIFLVISLFIVFFIANNFAQAADEIKLTITPPLIKNNMNKGESWASTLKVVNNGMESIVVYAEVSDFKSRADGVGPEFVKKENLSEKDAHYLLSQWMEIEQGPISIPAQQSVDIPFAIKLPNDIEPGGHYAAILVGTKPGDNVSGTAIKTSSLLASLIMLEVKGDIQEKADISQFATDKVFYQKPNTEFLIKFENQGNIHLKPQGEIKIVSPWGTEKERILVNQGSEFGNVLPGSAREWKFDWNGKTSFWEMGRYRADLALSFGNDAQQTIAQSLFFWVINVKLLGITISIALIIILLIVWLIKRYVRKAILATANANNINIEALEQNNKPKGQVLRQALVTKRFDSSGAVDLRSKNEVGRKRLN